MDSALVNAVTNCPSTGLVDKSKEWQMEMLMEKLRSKAGQFKSFFESAKALRMTLLEKRYPVDSMERNQLHKCLDTLQQNIKVTTLQAMVERLESVSRQLGLTFVAGLSGLDLFISSDMFYLEVVLEPSGGVKDVKIHHEGKVEQQSCEELVTCLTRRDFTDFAAQLEGLASIYQLNADKKVKSKAFSALASLEADLATLASLQNFIKEPFNLVHKSPVGVLQERKGGHPMKLTYFVSPYDLLDTVNKTLKPLSVENLDVGYSVTVCMEGSISHKLQTSTLITVNTSGKNLVPVYGSLTNQNSANLPACFVFKLNRPMPMCVSLVQKIQQVTEITCGDVSSPVPLLSLITQHANMTASGSLDSVDNRGLFVVLPDQVHCYFMTENRQLDGTVVNSIPFTHPAHVPQILTYLRQQAMLNTVIASCIRPTANKQNVDIEKMIMMEVTPLSWQQVSVSLEHPLEESMATAELDLTDIGNVTCKVYTSSSDNHLSEYANRVLQRSLSIPVTMRALIRSWQREVTQGRQPDSNGLPGGSSGSGSGGSSSGSGGGGNISGGGPLSGPGGGADHTLNIKPDPDRGNDCEAMVTDTIDGLSSANLNLSAASEQKTQNSGQENLLNLLSEHKQSKKRKWKQKKSDDCEEIILETSSSDSVASKEEETSSEPEAKKKAHSPNQILLDLENKNLVPPSVSITPIPCLNSVISLERRPGIEIIPITTAMSNSITITPITKDSKKSNRSSDEKEKKRKRRREESGMGPPKQDPLSKPVTVSIKPAECGSPRPSSPIRTPVKSMKHSPSPVYSSPKSSPKHGTSSPGSGKPSMSALKSAVSSPKSDSSSKSSSKPSSKDSSSRDKDRKSSGSGHQSPKLKSSSVKLKQLDLSCSEFSSSGGQSGGSTPPSGSGDGKGSQPQVRNRKGSLSAVIDKLKSAQHCTDSVAGEGGNGGSGKSSTSSSSSSSSNKERSSTPGKIGEKGSGIGNKPGDAKVPGEYMVKHSSDGMKITINKTRAKDSVKSSSKSQSGSTNSGSGSPKTHTGLKPGVNSGPASKKPQQISPKSGSIKTSSKFSKTVSSALKNMKVSTSKDGKRPLKPISSSIFAKSESKKLSPSAHREDKAETLAAIPPQLVVEGLMKQLDPNFQIPKLSARQSTNTDNDKKNDKNDNVRNSTDQNKFIDLTITKHEKGVSAQKTEELTESKVPHDSEPSEIIESKMSKEELQHSSAGTINEEISDIDSKKISTTTPQEAAEILLDISTSLPNKVVTNDKLISLPICKNTPPPPPPPLPPPAFPASPSVSVHIVKSPAPSPLIIPSPHSASPCITDDELMDEALVGIGK